MYTLTFCPRHAARPATRWRKPRARLGPFGRLRRPAPDRNEALDKGQGLSGRLRLLPELDAQLPLRANTLTWVRTNFETKIGGPFSRGVMGCMLQSILSSPAQPCYHRAFGLGERR